MGSETLLAWHMMVVPDSVKTCKSRHPWDQYNMGDLKCSLCMYVAETCVTKCTPSFAGKVSTFNGDLLAAEVWLVNIWFFYYFKNVKLSWKLC